MTAIREAMENPDKTDPVPPVLAAYASGNVRDGVKAAMASENGLRIQEDLVYFEGQAATGDDGTEMFTKHLAFRCKELAAVRTALDFSWCSADALRNVQNCPSCWESQAPWTRIWFGQYAVSETFSQAPTTEHDTLGAYGVHILNTRLTVVATNLQHVAAAGQGIPQDVLVVRVALWRNPNNAADVKWISLNNRAFTTHNLANLPPLRVLPALATQGELNRVNHPLARGGQGGQPLDTMRIRNGQGPNGGDQVVNLRPALVDQQIAMDAW